MLLFASMPMVHVIDSSQLAGIVIPSKVPFEPHFNEVAQLAENPMDVLVEVEFVLVSLTPLFLVVPWAVDFESPLSAPVVREHVSPLSQGSLLSMRSMGSP